ncbi:MAG: carboxypeptidase-like regulatory domain-containing protein, partial [bacterium]
MYPSPSPGRSMAGQAKEKRHVRVMNLTALLLLATCLQVGATGYAQKVSLRAKDITLEQLFGQLRRQTGFQFLYADEALKTARPVSVSVRNAELAEVLADCFRDQPLTYTISDRTIIVKRRQAIPIVEATKTEAVADEKVAIDVRGTVTDNGGQPLSGVSISVKGSAQGTTSDASGAYRLSVPEDAVLVFSYIGFVTAEQRVQGRSIIDVSLAPSQRKI